MNMLLVTLIGWYLFCADMKFVAAPLTVPHTCTLNLQEAAKFATEAEAMENLQSGEKVAPLLSNR